MSLANQEVRDDPLEPARRDDHEGEGATRGTARMEAFADAVFAIAFTLPVVEIHLPEASGPGGLLAAELEHLWPSYLGYLLASGVIGLYWVHHHFSGAIYRTTGHWFLIATAVFLAAIGFIAFPARVVAEHFTDPAARDAASVYWVWALALVSVTWLLKWTVGWRRGQVDSRLEPSYVSRLNRLYWALTIVNVAAAVIALWNWRVGLVLSSAALAALIIPPQTPRYRTEAPIVEGES
jgi:uncharacterized membrane protein